MFHDRWLFFDEEDGTGGDLGLLYEITLACHALQHEVCFNCKCRNALRWNGGSSISWQDLVCIACGCMYEVKTKADMQMVDNCFRYHKGTGVPGGSFLGFLPTPELKATRSKDVPSAPTKETLCESES